MSPRIYSSPMLWMSLLVASTAHAEWTSDPSKNSAVANVVGLNQVLPKISASADRGWYASWFTRNPREPVPVALTLNFQRLQSDGSESLPHNGLQIAKMSLHSSENFALDTDGSGNALLAFVDTRSNVTGSQIAVTKIDPTGRPLWGDSGVTFKTQDTFHAPKIAVTTDGGVVLAWSTYFRVVLHKLDAEGRPVWTGTTAPETGVVLGESDFTYELDNLRASDDGGVIVTFTRRGHYLNYAKHLYANKLAADGKLLWSSGHVKLFDAGSLDGSDFSSRTASSIASDGKGGAIFSWFSQNPISQVHVQHILADGKEAFPHNGVHPSTNDRHWRDQPTISYRAASDEIFLFWSEIAFADSRQKRGVYGQKFSADGSRQWGEQGRVIVPAGSSFQTSISSIQADDGVFVFWIDAPKRFEKSSIQAIKLDSNGKDLCSQFVVSSSPSNKAHLAVNVDRSGRQLVLAWEDDRSNVGYDEILRQNVNDIFMQNVNLNCSLGIGR